MKEYIILMADIIDSRDKDQQQLMKDFKSLVEELNLTNRFVSPLTITLGDEFQGVMHTMAEAVRVILQLEEVLIRDHRNFKLRYVAVEGLIETPVNPQIAYGMLGDGLTRARKYLENLKDSHSRFFFWMKDQPVKNALNNLFIAIQELIADWNPERDYHLVTAFLKFGDHNKVAKELKKDRTLMWKRRKSLQINTYIALKEVADYITHE